MAMVLRLFYWLLISGSLLHANVLGVPFSTEEGCEAAKAIDNEHHDYAECVNVPGEAPPATSTLLLPKS